MFKVNNRNTRKGCEICSKLRVTPDCLPLVTHFLDRKTKLRITLLSEQQIRQVTEIIWTNQDLHMKILIKSLFVPLLQWFRSTQQGMLKRKGTLEDFSGYFSTESLRLLYTK